jgi:hypothetical protein
MDIPCKKKYFFPPIDLDKFLNILYDEISDLQGMTI